MNNHLEHLNPKSIHSLNDLQLRKEYLEARMEYQKEKIIDSYKVFTDPYQGSKSRMDNFNATLNRLFLIIDGASMGIKIAQKLRRILRRHKRD